MKKSLIAGAVMLAVSGTASAADIDSLQNLGQAQFKSFSEDLGAALSYKALAPAEPLGLLGFDIGLEVTATSIDKNTFGAATNDTGISTLPVPKLHAHKGLPFGIDVGLSYTSIPGTNMSVTGMELRYAILEGGMVMPALAVRGTYSVLDGVDQLDLETTGVELTVSKGFGVGVKLIPYGGIGQVNVTSTPNLSSNPLNIQKEELSLTKTYVGLAVNLALVNFTFEGDQTGDNTTYSAKMGLRF